MKKSTKIDLIQGPVALLVLLLTLMYLPAAGALAPIMGVAGLALAIGWIAFWEPRYLRVHKEERLMADLLVEAKRDVENLLRETER